MKVKSESEDAQSCLTLSDLMDCSLPGSSGAWDFLGKSTGVGCHCLLQHDGLGTYYIWQENWNNLLPPLPNFHLITTPCFCELYSLSLLRSTDFFSYTVCGVFSNFMILFLIFVKIKKLFLPFCLVKFIHHDLEEVFNYIVVQFSSSTQLCLTLWDPMYCSMPGLPVNHQCLEFTQTHVHWVGDAIQPSHPLSSPSSPIFNPFQHQGLNKWVSSLHQVSKVLEFQLQHQSFLWTLRTDLL